MGNHQSIAYQKVERILPDSAWEKEKYNEREGKKDQFICAILALLSKNGSVTLDNYDFKLFYSRRPNERVLATLVAVMNGVIEMKLEPSSDGETEVEAFMAFKRYVESSLHELLENVPETTKTTATARLMKSPSAAAADLPPAYESSKGANLGLEVSSDPSATPDNAVALRGKYVALEAPTRQHIVSLWRNLRPDQNGYLYDYLPWGAPESEDELWESTQRLGEYGFIWYAIRADPARVNPGTSAPAPGAGGDGEVLGLIGYINIHPEYRELEVGGVLFAPALQRSVAATELHYLLLRNVCDENSPGLAGGASMPYRRIVWRCNHLNTPSRRAAERLGYVFEGTMRKNFIFKGRSRDTDMFSIIDDEWPAVKAALEKWLEGDNFDSQGRQLKSLEEIRAGLK